MATLSRVNVDSGRLAVHELSPDAAKERSGRPRGAWGSPRTRRPGSASPASPVRTRGLLAPDLAGRAASRQVTRRGGLAGTPTSCRPLVGMLHPQLGATVMLGRGWSRRVVVPKDGLHDGSDDGEEDEQGHDH